MSSPAVVAENVGKKYNLRHQSSSSKEKDGVENKTSFIEEFWALEDVSFRIDPGEVVGVIGRNGAGKSTLLKVLSRITEPTRGRVRINGRVASLLEVGTGFHAELTGRENIFLNGTILGMTRAEIRRKFDEIVAFAEVEKFLDTPVKHYSSGMYVRLAFAVAAHLEPEILIVDEVLAVGDTQFQKKCLGKMQDVSQREGRTVLFVSHNMAAVSTLTQRVILLNSGRVEYSGSPQEGINLYLAAGANPDSIYVAPSSDTTLRLTRAEVICSEPNQTQASGKSWSALFQFSSPRPAHLSFQIINQEQNPVLHLKADSQLSVRPGAGSVEVRCDIRKLDLNVGSYHLKVYLFQSPEGPADETVDQICPFEVVVLDRTTRFGWRPEVCAYIVAGDWSVNGSPVS
jgi:lipopolysaccharide transport system ATP-binding protein